MPRKYWGMLRTLCNPSTFRTPVYSKPWHIQNQRHMQNPGVFGTEVYSEPWDTQNSTQTQNPVKHSTMERWAKVVNNYSCFSQISYFCNISFSLSLLFKIFYRSISCCDSVYSMSKKHSSPEGRGPLILIYPHHVVIFFL